MKNIQNYGIILSGATNDTIPYRRTYALPQECADWRHRRDGSRPRKAEELPCQIQRENRLVRGHWSKFGGETEIYALVLKGTVDIQGLIALTDDEQSNAVYINWACTSPENNVWRNGSKLYEGVGGHLLAIAINISEQRGHGGCVHAIAMDKEILQHYAEVFDAIVVGILHPFHFVIEEESAKKIQEVYKYEWSDDEL